MRNVKENHLVKDSVHFVIIINQVGDEFQYILKIEEKISVYKEYCQRSNVIKFIKIKPTHNEIYHILQYM